MQPATQDHIEETTLEIYALGKLADHSAAGVEEHLLVCGLCRERLMESEAYIRAMKRAAQALAGKARIPRPPQAR